jgi:hypothetical protein
LEIQKQGAHVVADEGSPATVKVNEAALPAGAPAVQGEGEQASAAGKKVDPKTHLERAARVVQSEGERL